MIDTMLLATISVLLSVIGFLGLQSFKDISRRTGNVEEVLKKHNAALIALAMILVVKEHDSDAISKVLTNLLEST